MLTETRTETRTGKWTASLSEDLSDLPEEAPVFGMRSWLEATRRALPFPLKVLRIHKGSALAAYLPLQFIKRGGLVKAFVPILTFYGGPYFIPGRRRHFNEEVREHYEILGVILAWLERNAHYSLLLPEEHDVRPALERNWLCLPRYTVVNLLKAPDALEANKDCLANIRKAEKAGLTFGATDGEDQFEAAYARTFIRKGLAMKWRPRWAADLRRELTGTGLMEHLAVRNPEGKAIAFASVALDRFRKSAIIWCSCSLAEADRTGAMHFLIHRLILRYQGRFETFDLCGADHRSLSEFKEKFANQLVGRFSLEKYRGPGSKALLKGFEIGNGFVKSLFRSGRKGAGGDG
ncbi:MAG: hypothetical protein JWP91_4099 [Fibrobacteres bacterium]|nr:hypothetical protein [Fibrobacterota bacterium]